MHLRFFTRNDKNALKVKNNPKKKKLEIHFRKNGSGQLVGALHGVPHARPSCQEHRVREGHDIQKLAQEPRVIHIEDVIYVEQELADLLQ